MIEVLSYCIYSFLSIWIHIWAKHTHSYLVIFFCKVRHNGVPFMFSNGMCDKLVVPHMVLLVAVLMWKNLYNGTMDYKP